MSGAAGRAVPPRLRHTPHACTRAVAAVAASLYGGTAPACPLPQAHLGDQKLCQGAGAVRQDCGGGGAGGASPRPPPHRSAGVGPAGVMSRWRCGPPACPVANSLLSNLAAVAGWNKLTVGLYTHARNGLTGEHAPPCCAYRASPRVVPLRPASCRHCHLSPLYLLQGSELHE